MDRTAFSRSNGGVRYLVSLALLAVYSLSCWIVYENHSIAFMKTVAEFIPEFHSGNYYSQAADRLQYEPHAPGEIDRLYKRAMIRSPADSKVFMSYFQYLESRDCCLEQTSLALEETLRRNPASTKPYAVAVTFFLDTGQKAKAFHYFRNGAELGPKSLRAVLSAVADRDLSMEEIIQMIPRNTEGLSFLAEYLARKGPSEKEAWYRTVQELHATAPEPYEALRTAEQALRLGEIRLARQYAEMAFKNAETQAGAKKLLAKIDRVKISE